MRLTLESAISKFGAAAKQKLANIAAAGEPEDQLRAPFEHLLTDMAELVGIPRTKITAVGESSLRDLKTRPDYAVTVHNALVGFVELKAPVPVTRLLGPTDTAVPLFSRLMPAGLSLITLD